QELELDKGELDAPAVELHRPLGEIEREPVDGDEIAPIVAAAQGGPAQQGAHSAPELANRERLRDVVVCAKLEPDHLVQLVLASGEHDDRNGTLGAEAAAHLETVELRQHQVED